MTETDYLPLALRTWTAPLRGTPEGVAYLLWGLDSELGEVSAVFKRMLRDGTPLDVAQDRFDDEFGDVLWYWTMLQWEEQQGNYDPLNRTGMNDWPWELHINARCQGAMNVGLNVSPERSRARNIAKLASRAERGVIQGSGGDR